MDNWIKHDGKGMPVDGDTLVCVRFRDGKSPRWANEERAAIGWHPCWEFETEQSCADITEYRVVYEDEHD